MLIALVESRVKEGRDVWEDVLRGRHEMATPPPIGSVVRLSDDAGGFRRYRVRELVYDLPSAHHAERVVEQLAVVYLVHIPSFGASPQMELQLLRAEQEEG